MIYFINPETCRAICSKRVRATVLNQKNCSEIFDSLLHTLHDKHEINPDNVSTHAMVKYLGCKQTSMRSGLYSQGTI